jgi:hypothetical protein
MRAARPHPWLAASVSFVFPMAPIHPHSKPGHVDPLPSFESGSGTQEVSNRAGRGSFQLSHMWAFPVSDVVARLRQAIEAAALSYLVYRIRNTYPP